MAESSFSRRKNIVKCNTPHEQVRLILNETVEMVYQIKSVIENGFERNPKKLFTTS